MHKNIERIIITEEELKNRIKEIAEQVNKEFMGERIVLVALLTGSIPFLSELMKHIENDCEIELMDVSSYHGEKSTGEVKVNKDIEHNIYNKNVIIVEDIIDTGRTLSLIKEILMKRSPKSLKIITMLDKKEGRIVDIEADFVGFEIPNEFVVGFGLDFNELYRNLPYIGVLRKECYK